MRGQPRGPSKWKGWLWARLACCLGSDYGGVAASLSKEGRGRSHMDWLAVKDFMRLWGDQGVGEVTCTKSDSPLGPPDKGRSSQRLRGGTSGCPICTKPEEEVETPA